MSNKVFKKFNKFISYLPEVFEFIGLFILFTLQLSILLCMGIYFSMKEGFKYLWFKLRY